MAQLKRYNGASWDIVGGVVTGDTLPIGSEIDYDGETAPVGWQEIEDYSTSEVKTGENWIDGKPIYRKVIYISSLPNNTGTQYSHGISNVDKIWVNQSKSFIYWSSLGNSSPFPYISMGDASTPVGYNAMIELRSIGKTTFEIKTAYDRSSLSAYVTLEYTKTTD